MRDQNTKQPRPYWFYAKLFAVMVIGFYYLFTKTARWIIQQQFALNK